MGPAYPDERVVIPWAILVAVDAADPTPSTDYTSYLHLDEILGAQQRRSTEHDEMLFIVVHQVYELWFKQLLHELAFLQERLEAGDTAHALSTARRVLTILKTAVAQVDVLETMTPRQFTSFRDRLDTASGFQSAQFRELEAVLGARDDGVLAHHPAGSVARRRIEDAMARRSVFDSLLRYLATQGFAVPSAALEREVRAPLLASAGVQAVLLDVYAADGEPSRVCERLVDLDEGVQEWRYRHVKMVERTIGDRRGTGGSSGVEYLRSTLLHPVFPDLWAIRARL
jgi:tryptophan 2,3-dioxygenase